MVIKVGSHLSCLCLLHPEAGVRQKTPGLSFSKAWHGGQEVKVSIVLLDDLFKREMEVKFVAGFKNVGWEMCLFLSFLNVIDDN